MRSLRTVIRCIGVLLLCAFAALILKLVSTVWTQGTRLTASQYNNRIANARTSTAMGEITDRNGILLAWTDGDGIRQYHEDESMRRALSQTVGDQRNMSGTGVETFHANTLLEIGGSAFSRAWQYFTRDFYQGDNIRLTVDAQLTRYISDIFPKGYQGAVAVMNYKTGEILAMVSKPDYDPQNIAAETDGGEGVFLNRCLQGRYTPGSVFKIVTLASALQNITDAQERSYSCDSSRVFGDGRVTCYENTSHGGMNLMQAFVKSCNVTFASLAYEIGDEKLVSTCESFGFNDDFQFRDIILYDSSVPKQIDSVFELAWTGVGQGKLEVTPLHMAMIASAVANDGIMQEPRLIAKITTVNGITKPRASSGIYRNALPAETAEIIAEYMRHVVTGGTGKNAAVPGWTVCGKTGTAETSDDKNVKANSWFVGYIQEEACPYAVAVVVEKGGAGSGLAATLAGEVLAKAAERFSGR